MPEAFTMKIDEIQPSQLFISSEKLSQVLKSFDLVKPESIEPIPVKELGNQVVFADGHTRAFAAFQHGLSEIPVYLEVDELITKMEVPLFLYIYDDEFRQDYDERMANHVMDMGKTLK